MQRIADVAQEYLAARSAAELLAAQTKSDPSFGVSQGWNLRAGAAFVQNLEATYLIRMFAEFEAGLREYWRSHLGRRTHPNMEHLLRNLIPNQLFSHDCIDAADEVRTYRNSLVHLGVNTPPLPRQGFKIHEAKRRRCEYFSRLDSQW